MTYILRDFCTLCSKSRLISENLSRVFTAFKNHLFIFLHFVVIVKGMLVT